MIKRFLVIFAAALFFTGAFLLCIPEAVYAAKGESGYEGGITSGAAAGKTISEYCEVSFITGEPIVFKGSLSVKKSVKADAVTTTYTYNLKNDASSSALTRTIVLKAVSRKAANGQTIEDATLVRATETIRTPNRTYTLVDYELSNTFITDPKPAVNYFSGNTIGYKVYQAGADAGGNSQGGMVTVRTTGSFYGYDQYWSSSEAGELNISVSSEEVRNGEAVRWGGTAKVTVASSMSKKLQYVKNEPYHISFSGGYLQSQNNTAILEYSSRMPEFDAEGYPLDRIENRSGSERLDTMPVQTRLAVPELTELRGHWAEKDIELLCSLEILDSNNFMDPERLITRAEFVAAVVNAVKEAPQETASVSKLVTNRKTKKETIISPFADVSIDGPYFSQIDSAVRRGIVSGTNTGKFLPDSAVTRAEAITLFIRALGLESLSEGSSAVTGFADNNQIPSYARSSVSAARKIGLATGDERGFFRPAEKLTAAAAAGLITRLLEYMREDMGRDYLVDYVNFQ